jgi:hypothetical protein
MKATGRLVLAVLAASPEEFEKPRLKELDDLKTTTEGKPMAKSTFGLRTPVLWSALANRSMT